VTGNRSYCQDVPHTSCPCDTSDIHNIVLKDLIHESAVETTRIYREYIE